jgi:hypothetical protein
MIIVNFGPGGTSQFPREMSLPSGRTLRLPDTPLDIITTDQILVPETGDLDSFTIEVDQFDLTYDPRWPRLFYKLGLLRRPGYSAKRAVFTTPQQRLGVIVEFPDLPHIKKHKVEKFRALLLWIEERGQWIAVAHREFLELYGGSSFTYRGPFSLNALCKSALARAYGIAHVPNDIDRWAPDQLDKRTREMP